MSLEQAITELNTNIQALIAALGAQGVPAAIEKEPTPPPDNVAPINKAPAAAKPAAKAEPEPTVTAEELRKLFVQLLDKRGRDVAMTVLAEEGVSRAGELSPARYVPVYKTITNLLKGH